LKCIIAAMAAALLVGLGLMGTASADPLDTTKSVVTSLKCEGEELVFVVRTDNSTVTAHQVGKTNVFIATHFSVEFIDPGSGEVVFSFGGPVGEGDKEGLQKDLVTCTTTFEADGLIHHDTVIGFFTPRAGA
jgi:hypothetical protein